eukprot:4579805-Prymnesium_polylepis.1
MFLARVEERARAVGLRAHDGHRVEGRVLAGALVPAARALKVVRVLRNEVVDHLLALALVRRPEDVPQAARAENHDAVAAADRLEEAAAPRRVALRAHVAAA